MGDTLTGDAADRLAIRGRSTPGRTAPIGGCVRSRPPCSLQTAR
jgi:hypothetical protein